MATKTPGMITGANAKITITDPTSAEGKSITLAYASDVNYDLRIDHIPVEVMNKYEVVSNEPVSMALSGSFTVVRYIEKAVLAKTSVKQGDKDIDVPALLTPGGDASAKSNSVNLWGIGKPFSPGDLLGSSTFDISIYQRYVKADGQEDSTLFLKFKNCRITSRSTSLNKRSVMSERFDFVGETMDDDAITSGSSGDSDLS